MDRPHHLRDPVHGVGRAMTFLITGLVIALALLGAAVWLLTLEHRAMRRDEEEHRLRAAGGVTGEERP